MARTLERGTNGIGRCAVACAVAALGLFLAALAAPLHAQTAAATCPADTAAALAAFADPAPDVASSLALLTCSEPLARERALLALADAEMQTPETLGAIADALEDRVETVRQQAVIAMLRNAAAARPVLVARLDDMAPSRLDADLRRADHAAVMLATLGTEGVPIPAGRAARWGSIWNPGDRARFAYMSGWGSGKRDAPLSAPTIEDRRAALDRECDGLYDAVALECPSLDAGGRALADAIFMTRQYGFETNVAHNMLVLLVEQQRFDRARLAQATPPAPPPPPAPGTAGSTGAPEVTTLPDGSVVPKPPATPADPPSPPVTPRLSGSLFRGLLGTYSTGPRTGAVRPAAPPPPPPPMAERGAEEEPALPRFPWPAPKPVRQQVVPVSAVGGPNATLDQVAARLRRTVQAVDPDFETGLFSGPKNGFVMMTRIERIQADGTPFPAPHRFTTRGNPSAGFLDALRSLMGERPGHFRVIAFVVADTLEIDPKQPVSTIPLNAIGDAQTLPPSMGKKKLGSRKITALVYAFERKPGKAQKPWIEGAPSALKHLQASGIGAKLGL